MLIIKKPSTPNEELLSKENLNTENDIVCILATNT